MEPMRLMLAAQASIDSQRSVFPAEAWPRTAKLRMLSGECGEFMRCPLPSTWLDSLVCDQVTVHPDTKNENKEVRRVISPPRHPQRHCPQNRWRRNKAAGCSTGGNRGNGESGGKGGS